MQVNIERETLLKGIGHALGVVDKRGSLPILSHCLLQTNGNGVFISATDLEVSFRGFYPAEVKEPGALTVQAGFFNNIIKDLPKGPLALVGTDKAAMEIRTGDSHYQLYGLGAEQFPAIPEAVAGNLMEVESRLLKGMIQKTIFSVSGEDLQFNLSGIFWEKVETDEGVFLRLVSTDGHRLTLMERPLPEGEQLELGAGILVPYKAMREIGKFLDGQEKVTLGLDGKTLSLEAADKHLFIRLLDRKFPEYRRIIPEGFAYRFSVDRKEFTETLRRIAQLSSDRFKGVIFNLAADSVEVTFANPDVGEGRELLPVNLEEGDLDQLPLEVGFNARYLLEPLQAMGGDTVFLEINDRDHPCRIMEPGDAHYFSLVMPMSL
ncbi:MAG: DNA polymerase III subunit beta [Syntrophales bacterium]|nr:DNA polymerase III subunit beta [Syntrophales bacterium]MDD5641250.1 DNA polymerase III subunit beta [Syntrophales bacterium]